jgi:hypothetical protein
VKFKKGNSYWTFNNSLLKDHQYVSEINNLIKCVRSLYTSKIQTSDLNPDLISDTDIILSISDQLFFGTLMMEIPDKTIVYPLKKSKDQREQ